MMSFNDSILANIKKQESDDDGETFMEVLGRFNEPETSINYDPLNAGNDVEVERKFQWQCDGTQFLRQYKDEEDDMGPSKTKIAKAELKSSTGQMWSMVPPTQPTADELPEFVPTGKGPAKSVTNLLEAWHLLFDVPMLSQIVKSTNEEIKATKRKESYEKRLTDMTEMRAWLGLNYLCGVLRNSLCPGPIEELWTLELGNAIFRATMTYKRFEFINKCLRCVEQPDDSSHPLDSVGDLWEKLIINCRSYYAPSDFCMIDEHILDLSTDPYSPFDHQISPMYNSKGLRFITMCDAKTLYISNAIIASNCDPLDEEVYQLISDIKGSRRCLCMRERFSSLHLMQKLKQYRLQVVGSLEHNAHEIPSELSNTSNDFQMWYTKHDTTLICGPGENVTSTGFLLTNGLSARIDGTKLYQTIKDSNSKAIENMQKYSTKYARANNPYSWSLKHFYFMLDLAAFNAWILYRLSENGEAELEYRDFLRQLGLYLTQQQLKQRIHINLKVPLPLKLQIAEILGENGDAVLANASKATDAANKTGSIPAEKALIGAGIVLQSRENDNRRRCRGCKSRNGSKIKTRCQQCLTPYCMRHLISRCEKCSGYELQQSELDTSKVEESIPVDLDVSQE
ncbi:uncharacterized protein [Musca autumnalis]|uniref:uncharacterized protein n=1 Tax=Musca autumnalis TaxID=221902 RepID=UPI003CEBF892